MIVALIDNGSLEPDAHQNLRAVAAALSARVGVSVEAVSWKHSDRIVLGSAGLRPAHSESGRDARAPNGLLAPIWTLAPFIRAHVARGEREFLFVPFFISAQGAIGSALRGDLENLAAESAESATPGAAGFSFAFTEGLAARGALAPIVAARIRETITAKNLSAPAIIVVDHGGPSAASAVLRDATAAQVRALLGAEITSLTAASMEGAHGPLFADTFAALASAPISQPRDVVIAPLFLSPGRHAGPDGDLAQIARGATSEIADTTPPRDRVAAPRIHFTDLVGTHPAAIDALAAALRTALTSTPLSLSA